MSLRDLVSWYLWTVLFVVTAIGLLKLAIVVLQ